MKRFLIIIAIILAIVFALVLVAISMKSGLSGGAKVKDGSILVIDLSKSYPERGGFDFSGFKFKKKSEFLSLIKTIEKAAEDEKIIAISLKPDGLSLNFAQLDEFSEAIHKFKAAGKPVFSYISGGSMGSYLVASLADSISLAPSGDLLFLGFSINSMFFSGTAEKIGLGFEIVQAGIYKGAGEYFTEKRFTPPLKESLAAILDGLFGNWIYNVAINREVPEELIKEWLDYGFFYGDEALERGVVDLLEYPQQYEKRLLSLVEEEEKRLVSVSKYSQTIDSKKGGDKIALIYCLGQIHTGKTEKMPFGGDETIGSETFSKAIDDAAEDEDIEAIVLRVDSPGGSSLASDIIWKSIVGAKEKKPVVVSMGGTAASGGYYISMPADSIFCDPTTITGSIGVFFMRIYSDGLLEKLGISIDTLHRGGLADEFDINRPMGKDGYDAINRLIWRVYDDFVGKAANGRGMAQDSLEKIAQGRIWLGSDAVEIGLADRIAGFSEAIGVAAKMAGIEPEKARLVTYPANKGFFEFAMEFSRAPKIGGVSLPEPIVTALKPYIRLYELHGKGGILALMPIEIKLPR